MSLVETSRIHQIILESDETGTLARAFRHDLNLILKDGVELSRSLHILPLEAGDERQVALVGVALSEAALGLERHRQIAADAIASRDAAIARADNLEEQVAGAEAQLAKALARIAVLEANNE
jgi:hypothetical protein